MTPNLNCNSYNWQSEYSHSQVIKIEICDILLYVWYVQIILNNKGHGHGDDLWQSRIKLQEQRECGEDWAVC